MGDSTWTQLRDRPVPEVYDPTAQHLWHYPGGGINALHASNGILIRTHVEPESLQQAVRGAIAEVDPRGIVSGPSAIQSLLF